MTESTYKQIKTLCIIIGMVAGAILFFTPRSAHEQACEEFYTFKKYVEAGEIQRQMWRYEDKYGCSDLDKNRQPCHVVMPKFHYETYRGLVKKYKELMGIKD